MGNFISYFLVEGAAKEWEEEDGWLDVSVLAV